jgi:transcriptional regulator with XRE-family HTH domain
MFFTVSDFQDFLEDAAKEFDTKQAFAKAIGITPSRFSRLLAGVYKLNVRNCLRLANATGRPASVVLRAAGKGEIADLIESQYGPAAKSVSPKEREALEAWNALTERGRESLWLLMRELPRRDGEPLAIPMASHQPNDKTDRVSGGPRAADRRAAAALERLTRDAEQAGGLVRPARSARIAGEHVATPRPPKAGGHSRARTPRR